MEAFGTFLPLILIFVVFYFLLIRPQQRKVKQHKEMLSNLKRGDKIVTSGVIIFKTKDASTMFKIFSMRRKKYQYFI